MNDPMTCDAARPRLSAYLDGELPAPEAAAVAAHLEACIACREALDSLKAVSIATRQHLLPLAAPDLLRQRVRAALVQATREDESRPATRRGISWMRQVAAALVIAVASSAVTRAVLLRSSNEPDIAIREVVATHVRSLMTSHLTDVESTDEHNVKPWFDGKVAFAPDVVRLDSAGFVLVGGRVDSVGHEPVAALVYGRRKHVINLFTWPAVRSTSNDQVEEAVEHGYNVIRWNRGDMRFAAVSDLAAADLRAFVDAFRNGTGESEKPPK